MKTTDLSGFWAPTDDSRPSDHLFDHAASNWTKISSDAGWESGQNVVFRFVCDTTPGVGRNWIRVDATVGPCEIWLDGSYVGEFDDPVGPLCFEIISMQSEHDVVLHASHAPTSPFGVQLFETGPARLARHRLLCVEASTEHALFQFDCEVDTTAGGPTSVTMAFVRDGEIVDPENRRSTTR
jgi:hypothetical protein